MKRNIGLIVGILLVLAVGAGAQDSQRQRQAQSSDGQQKTRLSRRPT